MALPANESGYQPLFSPWRGALHLGASNQSERRTNCMLSILAGRGREQEMAVAGTVPGLPEVAVSKQKANGIE